MVKSVKPDQQTVRVRPIFRLPWEDHMPRLRRDASSAMARSASLTSSADPSDWGLPFPVETKLKIVHRSRQSDIKLRKSILKRNVRVKLRTRFSKRGPGMVEIEKSFKIKIEIYRIEIFRTEIKISFYRIGFLCFCFRFRYNFDNIEKLRFDIFRYKIQPVLFR